MSRARHPAIAEAAASPPDRRQSRYRDLSAGWLGKTAAGVVCGLAIALVVSGLFMLPDPRGNTVFDKYQIAMWMVPPVWLAVLSCCYLFRDAWRAWLWLGGSSAAGFVLFKVLGT